MGKITHGMSNTKLYKSYACAKARCECTTNKAYKRYGGRGIKFLWDSFDDFVKDMGEDYYKHLKERGPKNTSLDRIDNDGNYCKENCRWATRKEQSINRSYAIRVLYQGKEYPSVSALCDTFGLNYRLTLERIKYGRTIDDAVNEGLWRTNGIIYKGKRYKSLRSLCIEYNVKYGTVRKRIKIMGMPLDKAIV